MGKKKQMRSEVKGNVKNSIGRIAFAAFVRILECEREFQGVECGVADGERDAWVRISPPPRFCRRMSLADQSTAPTVPFPMTGKI